MEYIKSNQRITDFIESKYGKVNDETIKEFFVKDFYISSSEHHLKEEAYDVFKEEIDRILSFQNLSYKDMVFLGSGQTFTGIGIGDAVVKIGKKSYPILNLPYRLNPRYKKDLDSSFSIFVSQRAEIKGITESDVQNMYDRIRDDGGIWLDVKTENLGRLTGKKFDFESLYGKDNLYKGKDLEEISKKVSGNSNIRILDYEDVVFITPEIRNKILNYEPTDINSIKREIVRDNESLDDIYFYGYIVNSNKLLKYEENYQRKKGNFKRADECVQRYKENLKKEAQRQYEIEQIYRHGRYGNFIGKKYSIKEIAIRVTQKTTFSRFKRAVEDVKFKMFSMYQGLKERNNKFFDQEKKPAFQNVDDKEKVENDGIGNEDDIDKSLMFDPYTTR